MLFFIVRRGLGAIRNLIFLTLRSLFSIVKKSIPPDLQEQLKTLKALTKEIQQEKAKVREGPPALPSSANNPASHFHFHGLHSPLTAVTITWIFTVPSDGKHTPGLSVFLS